MGNRNVRRDFLNEAKEAFRRGLMKVDQILKTDDDDLEGIVGVVVDVDQAIEEAKAAANNLRAFKKGKA